MFWHKALNRLSFQAAILRVWLDNLDNLSGSQHIGIWSFQTIKVHLMDAQLEASPSPALKGKKARTTQRVPNGMNLNFPLSSANRAKLEEMGVTSRSAFVEAAIRNHLTTDKLPEYLAVGPSRRGTPRASVILSFEAHDRVQEVADNAGISMSAVVFALVSNCLADNGPKIARPKSPLIFTRAA